MVQISLEYTSTKEKLVERMWVISKSFTQTMSMGLWTYNASLIKGTLEGILIDQRIVGAKIFSGAAGYSSSIGLVEKHGKPVILNEIGGQPFEGPTKNRGLIDKFIVISFDLYHEDGLSEEKTKIGKGYIYSTEDQVLREVKGKLIIIIVTSILKTLALWVVMILFISRLIAIPLTELLDFSKKMNPKNDRFSFNHQNIGEHLLRRQDEIGSLANSLEFMRSELNARDSAIKSHANLLEAKVKDRTSKLASQLVKNENLIRVLCHDISNHITVVSGFLSILEIQNPFESHPKLTKHFQKAVKHIDITTEILDHVRQLQALESGKSELKLEKINLGNLLSEVEETFSEPLAKKSIELSIIGTEDPVYVLANSVSLKSNILNNLISNAIKFSPDQAKILVKVTQDEQQIQISIKDEGIGIPDDILQKIFDQKGATTRLGTSSESGTGFGLPIVYMFMKYNKGEISVRSNTSGPAKGTEFILKLQSPSAGEA